MLSSVSKSDIEGMLLATSFVFATGRAFVDKTLLNGFNCIPWRFVND